MLGGFGKKGQSKILCQLDRVTGDITTKKIRQVARQVKLMTEQDDTVLRDIEDGANGPIDKIRKRRLDQITETDRENVDELVLALLLNHPRFQKEPLRKEVVHDRYQSLTSTVECHGGLIDHQVAYATLHQYASQNNLLEFKRYGRRSRARLLLRSMGLTVHEPPPGESFVIGDYPVVDFSSDHVGCHRLPYQGLRVVLPISHNCLLMFDSMSDGNIIDEAAPVSLDLLRTLDEIYRTDPRCHYIYGRTMESLARSSKPHLVWSEANPSLLVDRRWSSVQSGIKNLERLEEERKTARESVMHLAVNALIAQAATTPINRKGE